MSCIYRVYNSWIDPRIYLDVRPTISRNDFKQFPPVRGQLIVHRSLPTIRCLLSAFLPLFPLPAAPVHR